MGRRGRKIKKAKVWGRGRRERETRTHWYSCSVGPRDEVVERAWRFSRICKNPNCQAIRHQSIIPTHAHAPQIIGAHASLFIAFLLIIHFLPPHLRLLQPPLLFFYSLFTCSFQTLSLSLSVSYTLLPSFPLIIFLYLLVIIIFLRTIKGR